MTFSEIHNKPTSIYSEDLLTSDVFGCCSFLQYHDLMKHILEKAVHFNSNKNFYSSENVCRDSYYFWPRFQIGKSQTTEPDLFVILWHSERDCSLILIESKYNSGKSSEPDESNVKITDQLARELSIIENKEIYIQVPELINANIISNALFYVTADDIMPRKSMKKSANEYFNKTHNYQSIEEIPIYWLPWWKIENICKELILNQNHTTKYRIIKHVQDVLASKELMRYYGIRPLILNLISFNYISDYMEHIKDYMYTSDFLPTQYKYHSLIVENMYDFNFQNEEIDYSYKMENA